MDAHHPAVEDAYANHAKALMRDALKREMESELRGLIMAANLHGFELRVEVVGDKREMVATVSEARR